MKILGIDIGTTTVSVVMTDTETGKLLAKETVEHKFCASRSVLLRTE